MYDISIEVADAAALNELQADISSKLAELKYKGLTKVVQVDADISDNEEE